MQVIVPSVTTTAPVENCGLDVLETCMSHYTLSKCEAIAETGNSICLMLRELNDPQSGLRLLRHCHVPKLNYLEL